MKILIDTNFILVCARQGIDFERLSDEIIDEKIEWIVPQQVLNELGNIKDSKVLKKEDRNAAVLAFELLGALNPNVVDVGKNPNIDIAIINYIIDKDIVLATLDKELKKRASGKRILTIKGEKRIVLV